MRIKRIGKVQRLAFRLQVWNVEADTVERQNGIIAGQELQKGGKDIFLIGGVLGKELVDAQKTVAPCGAADQVEIRARRREAGCLNIKKMQFSVNTSLETGSEKSKVSSSCQVII